MIRYMQWAREPATLLRGPCVLLCSPLHEPPADVTQQKQYDQSRVTLSGALRTPPLIHLARLARRRHL